MTIESPIGCHYQKCQEMANSTSGSSSQLDAQSGRQSGEHTTVTRLEMVGLPFWKYTRKDVRRVTVVVNAQADARPSKAGNIATLWAHYMNRMPGSAPATTKRCSGYTEHTTGIALTR